MKRSCTLLALAAMGASGLSAAPAAHAQTAYIDAFDQATENDVFGTVNLQSGAFTSINDALDVEFYALGFGTNGTLYGLADGGGTTDLYTVSTADGSVDFLHSFTTAEIDGASIGANGIFTGLTQPDADGQSTLFTLNPVAQTLTVGALTDVDADGLVAADGAGNVFATDATVAASGDDALAKVTATTGSTNFINDDTGLFLLTSGYYSNGKLYTFGYDTNSDGSFSLGAYTLSTTNGTPTLLANLPSLRPDGDYILASAAAPLAAAPEPSVWAGFLIGTLGLGVLGLRACKRQIETT